MGTAAGAIAGVIISKKNPVLGGIIGGVAGGGIGYGIGRGMDKKDGRY
ncbi:MAG: glycine zipper domain-containing protein [Bacteroidota bacterium]